jgi:D-alanyl-D-alanine carboxypeptidase
MIRSLFIGVVVVSMLFIPFTKIALAKDTVNLTSEAAILIDAKSGKVLYEKNSRERMYPASITKIITGIMALEQDNPEDTVTVSEKARNVDGTRVYLLEEERVSLYKLVQGLLINSGNDAGIAIAEHIEGSVDLFAESMNQFVKEKVGVTDSNFVNPHGLFDSNHYTTAYDMAKITQYAMQNEDFREIVGTKELKWDGEGWNTTLYNHNRMLWNYEGATGVKNGWVTQSGYTLVTAAKRGDTELIVVTLKANTEENIYKDTTELLDYGFANFETGKVSKGEIFQENNKKYLLEEDLFYTTSKGAIVKKEVNETGELLLRSNDEVITKEELKNLSVVEKQRNVNTKEEQTWLDSVVNFVVHYFVIH